MQHAVSALGFVGRRRVSTTTHRVAGIDVARAVAILGMMTVHIMPLTHVDPISGQSLPTAAGFLFSGSSSTLFAVLAGISLSLMSARQGGHDGFGRRMSVRALLLVLIGLICAELDTQVAVILVHYGLLFIIAVPFIRVPTRVLGWLAAGWIVLSGFVAGFFSQLMQSQVGAHEYVFEWRLWTSPSVVDFLTRPGLLLWDLLFTGYYPILQWTGFVLLGLFLGRLNFRRWSVSVMLLVIGAVISVGTWLLSVALLNMPMVREEIAEGTGTALNELDAALVTGSSIAPQIIQGTSSWYALATPHSGAPLDLLHTAGVALLVLGVCLVLCRIGRGVMQIPLFPILGAGSIPLTLYVGHLVALHFVPTPLSAEYVPTVTWWFVLSSLLLGAVIRGMGRRGPLEWVVSRLSQGVTTNNAIAQKS